ncbi:hypothetical protein M233_02035 [Xylella fastidiosa subsp. multiplex Griffin-1]|nr:hypothetical protein M233_02035 [Xylella fastidiosa subsp. multiplex Griffin-1]
MLAEPLGWLQSAQFLLFFDEKQLCLIAAVMRCDVLY